MRLPLYGCTSPFFIAESLRNSERSSFSLSSASFQRARACCLRLSLRGWKAISHGSGLIMSSELDLLSGTSISLPDTGSIFRLRLKSHIKAPQPVTVSSRVMDMPRHWRWPQPKDVMPTISGYLVNGSWNVGHPASNQRSG